MNTAVPVVSEMLEAFETFGPGEFLQVGFLIHDAVALTLLLIVTGQSLI